MSFHRSTDADVTPDDTEVGAVQIYGLDASGSGAESLVTQAPSAPGTYHYGVCVEPLPSEVDVTNNCSGPVAVTVALPPSDLLVDQLAVSDSSPMADQSLTLNVVVRNQGDGTSGPTTLSYHRSSDSTITPDDPEVGTVQISGLDASGSRAESLVTQAPSAPGTYYYGVCVDPVSGESDTTNNCSAALAIRVRPPQPDMEVGVLTVSDSGPMANQYLELSVSVRNEGGEPSSPTTLRYYRSTDATVTADDAEVGRDHVSRLTVSGSSAESVLTHAPTEPGTYHYGVCVDPAPGETNMANNCSTGVAVTVSPFSMERLPWVQDGLTGNETSVYDYIRDVAQIDRAMAQRLAGAPWVSDGVDEDELPTVLELRSLATSWLEVAALVTTIPDQTGGLMQDILSSLIRIRPYPEYEWLLSQPWVQDGLTAEEAALIVTLRSARSSQEFFEDLAQNGQVWSETISLPLAGEVDLFAVGRSRFWLQSALDAAAVAAEQSENLLETPWPKSDVIMLVETEDHGSTFRGLALNHGTYVMLRRPSNPTIYHELAHFYYSSSLFRGTHTPRWLTEGTANFMAHYTALKAAGGETSFRAAHLALKGPIAEECDPLGVMNIQGWTDSGLGLIRNDGTVRRCPYWLGTHFLARLHHALGHDAVASALQELYETREPFTRTTEEKIYQTFLRNTPPARKDEFRLLYHCLHGRPIAGYTAAPRAAPSSDVRDALVAVYNATNGPGWGNSENWLSDAPLDEWHGVVADCDGSVIALDLSENRLNGPIPPELGNLSGLGFLDLSGNQLSGEIPEALGKLADLVRLDLSENRLTGVIPAWLGALSGLSYLSLGDNQLGGEIPPELGQLSGLSGLVLPEMGQGSGLGYLDLSKNQLSGPIPPELGQFSGLGYLDLSVNQLSGPIPPQLGDLSNLEELYLNENQLSGEIPGGLGKLANLERLLLWGNQLTGEIPAWLGALSSLSHVSLGANRLSGPIPPELGDLPNLEELYLYENRLSGPIPTELGNLAGLDSLHLSGNQISGCIPAALKSVPRHDFDDVALPFCNG